MSPVEYRFIEPLDVLFLRGNKLFGDPGSFGESLVPPWPSVAAGAIRSRMLVDDGVDLVKFAEGGEPHRTLGTRANPGSFAITSFTLARRRVDGTVESLAALPADLVVSEATADKLEIRTLTPMTVGAGLQSSSPLPLLPILAETERGKPASGYWLTQTGWAKYLKGETPVADDLVATSELWKIDPRVGVGLDADMRRAADGRLFSVQAVAMVKRGHRVGQGNQAEYDVGFLAGIAGATPPKSGMVRLGGDGRAAAIDAVAPSIPEPDYQAIASAGACRIVLTSPGVFSQGWLPSGTTHTTNGEYRFDLRGVKGRLTCAAVPRAEVISGWDLAEKQPKPAQRVAPTGSVYWLDQLEASTDALRKLAEAGLWNDPCEDASRRAEGFNRIYMAAWK